MNNNWRGWRDCKREPITFGEVCWYVLAGAVILGSAWLIMLIVAAAQPLNFY